MPPLTDRYRDALGYAHDLHRTDVRKGAGVPYLSHLLAVSALVLEYGGAEDQAIAALLHDALEDHPHETSYDVIAERFGPDVAEVVRACSDTEVHPKPPWRGRKEGYLDRLAAAPPEAVLVAAADKLHNARSTLSDLRQLGPAAWRRFSTGAGDQLWYYDAVCRVVARGLPTAPGLVDELHRTVAALHDESGAHHPPH